MDFDEKPLKKNEFVIEEDELNLDKKPKKQTKIKKPWSKKKKIIVASVITLLLIALGVGIWFLLQPKTSEGKYNQDGSEPIRYYSKITGEEISDPALNSSPTYCMQIPNGMDGPRPQVGLNEASVVFEAIAEAGITRFAAVFQNNNNSALGPIRSLRPYYLDWDTPFDCTIVHAGGSQEALQALKSGNYRDLTESTTYMWRDNSNYVRPNNLFTSSELMNKFNSDHSFTTSDPSGFAHLLPDESKKQLEANLANADPDEVEKYQKANPLDSSTEPEDVETKATSRTVVPLVENITIKYGGNANYNPVYTYNQTTNSYDRAYASGKPHTSYTCPAELSKPKPQQQCGEPKQISPSVVIVLYVQQSTASDGYHQNIASTGSGKAVIFQNGQAIEATWSKPDTKTQLSFTDANNQPISLAPGQAWVSAIPTSTGSVNY